MLRYIGKISRRTVAGVFLMLMSYQPLAGHNCYHTVREGDYISAIARQELAESGRTPSMSEIVSEANRISKLNGEGKLEEHPWKSGYDCSTASSRDPNCIYPGEKIILCEQQDSSLKETMQKQHAGYPVKDQGYDSPWWRLPVAVAAGFAGTVAAAGTLTARKGRGKKAPPTRLPPITLDWLVDYKNRNPGRSLQWLVENSGVNEVKTVDELKDAYDQQLKRYAQRHGKYVRSFARYDQEVASEEMKAEMVELYRSSDKSLDFIAEQLSEKYGMHISSSTVSRYARLELGVMSRKQAREKSKISKLSRPRISELVNELLNGLLPGRQPRPSLISA